MSDQMEIQSHKGIYKVYFDDDSIGRLNENPPANAHYIIDKKVAGLYRRELENVLASDSVLLIEATEPNKTLDKFTSYIEHLVEKRIRRDHMLIAVGGGIIQDIVCFLAATLLRGVPWRFYPTTLLAQADSCIGSKSSINVGAVKNILGTFTPPNEVYIAPHVLKTLEEKEIRSGIGEMLKVHAIGGPASFDEIAGDFERIPNESGVMMKYIRQSLLFKKRLIEEDEFDKGVRNIMNYGHSFGHAIESATNFGIPHGIAVSMGMDLANYAAFRLGVSPEEHYLRMTPTLSLNYRGYENTDIPLSGFLSAISKDKKNTGTSLRLILPDKDGIISIGLYENDDEFKKICMDFFESERKK